jgi:hypothetical protein
MGNIRPISPGLDLLTRGVVCRPLLGCLARGALPRRRAFRRWRRGRPGAWVDSGERQTDVGFSPTFARTHTHTHTGAQRSSEQQAEAHGRLPRARRAASLRRARARARRSGSALGCAWQGHNSAREYLQEKGWLGAKAGVRQWWVAGARLTLALGCAQAQPPPSPSFAAQNTTARRAVHRNPRHDATRGTQHGGAA